MSKSKEGNGISHVFAGSTKIFVDFDWKLNCGLDSNIFPIDIFQIVSFDGLVLALRVSETFPLIQNFELYSFSCFFAVLLWRI